MHNHSNNSHQYKRIPKAELSYRLQSLLREDETEDKNNSREREYKAVLHELEVHQIELEMQNRELRESREELEESHERYINLYDFAPVGYATITDKGMVKEINLTAMSMLGFERRRLLGRSLAPWISAHELPLFRLHLKKCLLNEGKVITVLHLINKDKKSFPVEFSSTCVPDPLTGEMHFHTTITDLTARRNAEEERDRFFDLSKDPLCVINSLGYFERLNPVWEKLLGFSREELFSRPFIDFIHPDDRHFSSIQFEKVLSGEKLPPGFKNRYLKKDKGYVWLQWSVELLGSTVYAVARDSTKDILEKQSNENQYSWLYELIQSLPIALILADAASGSVLSASNEARDFLNEIQIPDVSDIAPDGCFYSDSAGNILNKCDWPRYRASRGETANGEELIWNTPFSKTHFLVWSKIIPAKYDHDEMVIVMLQNINPLKEREISLSESLKKLNVERQLRENFVSALSHDLRTPLTATKLSIQMMLKNGVDSSTFPKFAKKIITGVDRIDNMIRDLLDANKIHAGEKLPLKVDHFDLRELVKTTIDELKSTYYSKINVEATESVFGTWSEHNLRRVIENLVNNAVKYGSPHEPINVIVAKIGEHQVSLSVHNSGNPISEEDQLTLFEQFKRSQSADKSHQHGWGIGLTLVRGIVESHFGKIIVKSAPLTGTTFTVILPINLTH